MLPLHGLGPTTSSSSPTTAGTESLASAGSIDRTLRTVVPGFEWLIFGIGMPSGALERPAAIAAEQTFKHKARTTARDPCSSSGSLSLTTIFGQEAENSLGHAWPHCRHLLGLQECQPSWRRVHAGSGAALCSTSWCNQMALRRARSATVSSGSCW